MTARTFSMRPGRRARQGQALVEFALVLPVLAVLLLGGAQVGALLYGQITLDTAARDGARAASQQPNQSQAYANGQPLPMGELRTAINRGDTVSTIVAQSLSGTVTAGQTVLLVNTGASSAQAFTAASASGTTITVTGSPLAAFPFPSKSLVLVAHACTAAEYTSTDATKNTACQAVYKSLGFLSSPTTPVKTYVAPLCAASPSSVPDYSVPTCATGTTPCPSTSVDTGEVLVAVSYDVPLFVPIFDKLLQTPGKSAHSDVIQVSNRVTPCTMNGGE